jgi:hypothetical protein
MLREERPVVMRAGRRAGEIAKRCGAEPRILFRVYHYYYYYYHHYHYYYE